MGGKSCQACCCFCDARTGSLFVGILNLVVGTVAIVTLYFILSGISNEMLELQETERPSSKLEQRLDTLVEDYWSILLAYAFPSVVTFLIGLTVILASAKDNECLLLISVFMNGMLIIASFAISVILFVLAVHWFLLGPILFWGVVQVYFAVVLVCYRLNDMKTETVSKERGI